MRKGFFADALAHRPPLFRAMLAANRLPAAPPGREALSPASARLLDALWADPGGRACLRRACPAVFSPSVPSAAASAEGDGREGDRFVFWDYAEESRRLALLPPALLLRLGRLFGVAVHAPAMARLVRREDVLTLRAGLGDDLYHYALCRGQYQLGGARTPFAGRDRELPLPQRAGRHGLQALAVCAARWPEALRTRVTEALAAALAADEPEAALPAAACPGATPGAALAALPEEWREDAVTRVVWQAVKKLLIREVAPSWAPCFD